MFKNVDRSIDVHFSKGVGKRKGSWKGGAIGCGYTMLKNEGKNLIGYQIKSSDGEERIPEDWFNDRNVMSEKLAMKWIKDHGVEEDWKLSPVYEGDIKEPKFIFHL